MHGLTQSETELTLLVKLSQGLGKVILIENNTDTLMIDITWLSHNWHPFACVKILKNYVNKTLNAIVIATSLTCLIVVQSTLKSVKNKTKDGDLFPK